MRTRDDRPGIWSTWGLLLSGAWREVRQGGARLIGLILLFHLAIVVIAFPLIGWLFREALRAGGMAALDFGALRPGGGFGVSLALILVICLIAFWVVAVQFAVIVIALRRSRFGLPLTLRGLLRDLGGIARKLWRPSALPLAAYLFLLLPLTGFGFTTALAQGIAVPPFISGELLKESTTAIAWTLLMLALVLLNIRFALTLPVFALTDATGGRAMRLSWRITRGRAVVSLVGAILTVLVAAAIATVVLVILALVPTAIADEAAPDASPVVAAFSLGVAQVAGLLLTSLVTAAIGAVLVAFLARFKARLPEDLQLREPARGPEPRLGRGAVVALLTALCAAVAVGLGAAALPSMHRLAAYPDTFVLAHRGFTEGGVENTICSLEAAAEAGADLVEMDVMQTKDGRFVVMHDAKLSRLAGTDAAVKDLTLDELTAITVRAGDHECAIPSLDEYVTRAAELGMPLLIEIKMGGADTDDHVALLVAELESLDALERNIYHTLDAASAAELKHLRPDLTVGYIMPFAGGGVPDTPADFLVVEEWSASDEMQRDTEAAGLGFLVWTVNEETAIRQHLRRDTDGIITDRPDVALAARSEMGEEAGLADALLDALDRFVVVF